MVDGDDDYSGTGCMAVTSFDVEVRTGQIMLEGSFSRCFVTWSNCVVLGSVLIISMEERWC